MVVDGGGDVGGDVFVCMFVNVILNLIEEFWNDFVVLFEEVNLNIDVVIQNFGVEGVEVVVLCLFVVGDVFDVVQFIVLMIKFVFEFVDFFDYEWVLLGLFVDQYLIDGKNYMVGIGVQLQSLFFYNKIVFEEVGIIELFIMVDEFIEVFGKFKDVGWILIQIGGDWMSSYMLQVLGLLMIVVEDLEWFQDMLVGDVIFSEIYGDVVEMYVDWVFEGYIFIDVLGIKYLDVEQVFFFGKMVVYLMGSWFVGIQVKVVEFVDIGVFWVLVESVDEQFVMGVNIVSLYLIFKVSKNQDVVVKFIEFFIIDQIVVSDQFVVDGNFCDGYEYDMMLFGEELLQIVVDIFVEVYMFIGGGYGECMLFDGYVGEINIQIQVLIGGVLVDQVFQVMDDWFVVNVG